jgi:transposase
MAYRYGNREQVNLFPATIEEYVPADDPVRAFDAFVEALDTKALGLELDDSQVGNSSYDPMAMLKLLVYGYTYGFRSSRKLERAVHHNVSFMWLVGGLRPDHKTISEFRRCNRGVLRTVLKEAARVCLRLGLIEGNTLFVDGTKIRANASLSNTWDERRCRRTLEAIDRRIEGILNECDRTDAQEDAQGSIVHMDEELKSRKKLRERVAGILDDLKKSGRSSLNTTDPDSIRTRSGRGAHAGYNAQLAVDDKHGLIANADVVVKSEDTVQFADQIHDAAETLGKQPESAVADAGYYSPQELKKVHDKGISVVVPSPIHNASRPVDRYRRDGFTYDHERDEFTCPEGHRMRLMGQHGKRRRGYCIESAKLCRECCRFGTCTTSRRGRWINRHNDEDLIQELAENYRNNEELYAKRKTRVELPFGHIKTNMNVSTLLMRGMLGAKAEIGLAATGFNITRAINILGVQGLVARLA